MKEADFWKIRSDGKIACLLCPHVCKLNDGEVGYCNARQRKGDKLYSLNYGLITSMAMDPIEKKPLYHFHPGAYILSVGTFGCSFHCLFCQNASISQGPPHGSEITAQEIIVIAKDRKSLGVAYTYNEPMIWMEFVRECAELARAEGLKNVLVSNGYVNPEPLRELLPFIDAANIDLKSLDDSFYRNICKGKLHPVQNTCIKMKEAGVHVEVTNLVIPGENDSDENFIKLRDWVHDNLGPETVVHLSAYFPHYKFRAPSTPLSTLHRARDIVQEKINYVYLGNVVNPSSGDTACYNCGATLVRRSGYRIDTSGMEDNLCAACLSPTPFVS